MQPSHGGSHRRRPRPKAGLLATLCLAVTVSSHAELPAGVQVQASGVFINQAGDVLTARHAVSRCKSLYVVKDAQVAEAKILAMSADADLAVLTTSLRPLLAATLPAVPAVASAARPVFAESYDVLQDMPDRGRAMFNAMTVPGDGQLSMLSPVKPGASGSAVIGADGLMLGLVVERVATSSGMATRALSLGGPSLPSGATRVNAVPTNEIKRFLHESRIPFDASDTAQLGPRQATAARAATLSVGVICG